MHILKPFYQMIRFFVFLILPFAALFSTVLGPKIMLGILLFGLLLALFWTLSVETWAAYFYCASRTLPKGLARTVELGFLESSKPWPRILLLPRPQFGVLVFRGLFGRGTILISQGLLAAASEPELRSILRYYQEKLKQKNIVFHSACAVFWLFLIKWVPNAWVQLLESKQKSSVRSQISVSLHSLVGYFIFYSVLDFLSFSGSLSKSLLSLKVSFDQDLEFKNLVKSARQG